MTATDADLLATTRRFLHGAAELLLLPLPNPGRLKACRC